MKKKGTCIGLLILFFFLGIWTCFPLKVHADEPLIIVLDPGHGGENLGGQYESYVEKDLNIIVARAMKEELEKFEGVKVYLTRETDEEISIKDRALFAAQKQADFLFCLHFNMSVEHNLYGAEVWVPAGGVYYSKGYAFAEIEMQELTDLGLFSRGIKTRLNKSDENYYGILRYCTEEGVPSALIEHCHLDNPNDQGFYQQGTAQLEELGRLDARAVAKYFHLRSESLGIDYSNYPVADIPIPTGLVRPDPTEPEVCEVSLTNVDSDTGEIAVDVKASDQDSYIMYYDYSLDGGKSWSPLQPWPRPQVWNQSADSHSFTIQAPFDREIALLVTVRNGFDILTQSNLIRLDAIADPERLRLEAETEQQRLQEEQGIAGLQGEAEQEAAEGTADQKKIKDKAVELVEPDKRETSYALSNMVVFVLIILIILCMIFVVFVLVRTVRLALDSRRR